MQRMSIVLHAVIAVALAAAGGCVRQDRGVLLNVSYDPTRELYKDYNAAFVKLRAWNATMADAGWAAVSWPREYGGRGATVLEQLVYAEETTRARVPVHLNIIGMQLPDFPHRVRISLVQRCAIFRLRTGVTLA